MNPQQGTHADYLREMIAEIAEELPGFAALPPRVQQSLRELGEELFDAEFLPRLEGRINLPRYAEAMHGTSEADLEYISDQADFLRSSVTKAQREAHRQLLEKFSQLCSR